MQVMSMDKEGQATLYWRGNLTKAMGMDLGGELLQSLGECQSLILNLEKVEFLDFSCLVLLCAVKRQAAGKGKEMSLQGTENPAVATVIQRFHGNNAHNLCRVYCGNSCLFDGCVRK